MWVCGGVRRQRLLRLLLGGGCESSCVTVRLPLFPSNRKSDFPEGFDCYRNQFFISAPEIHAIKFRVWKTFVNPFSFDGCQTRDLYFHLLILTIIPELNVDEIGQSVSSTQWNRQNASLRSFVIVVILFLLCGLLGN